MLKPEALCYSIIWKRLAPCKFIEWNTIKKINKLSLYIMFQTTMPPSFPAFLNYNITIISCFPLEAGTLQRRGRDSRIVLLCALERRGKTPLFKALISSRSQSTLQRRQSSCLFGRWATESRGWSDSFTDLWQSRALGCGSVQCRPGTHDLAASGLENTTPGNALPRMLISTHSAASILNVAPWIIWTKMPTLVICNGFHFQWTGKTREQRNRFDTGASFEELNCRTAQLF